MVSEKKTFKLSLKKREVDIILNMTSLEIVSKESPFGQKRVENLFKKIERQVMKQI